MFEAKLRDKIRIALTARRGRASRGSLAAALVAFLLILAASPALGVTTFSTGAGSAVANVDRTATFDSLTTINNDLSNYTEGLLSITVNDINFIGFDAFHQGVETAFHYGSGGNNDFVTIRGTDDATFFALEFRLGDGRAGSLVTFLRWATFNNAVQISTGLVELPKGTIVGFSDPNGFDELRVAALDTVVEFGDFQAIAVDDVKVQLTPGFPTATPSPTATLTPTPTATPSPMPTASPTVTPTASPTVTPTASPTATPTASPTVTPTASPTVMPTASPTVTQTATPSPTPPAPGVHPDGLVWVYYSEADGDDGIPGCISNGEPCGISGDAGNRINLWIDGGNTPSEGTVCRFGDDGGSGDDLCGADILIEMVNGHFTGIEPTIPTLMCNPSCAVCDGICPLPLEPKTTRIRMNFRRGGAAPPVGRRRVATLIIDSSENSPETPTQVFVNGVGAAGANLQLRPIANVVGACTDVGEPFSCCTGEKTSANGRWPCGPRQIVPTRGMPEPGQLLQLLSGLAGLGCLYRLRRRA